MCSFLSVLTLSCINCRSEDAVSTQVGSGQIELFLRFLSGTNKTTALSIKSSRIL